MVTTRTNDGTISGVVNVGSALKKPDADGSLRKKKVVTMQEDGATQVASVSSSSHSPRRQVVKDWGFYYLDDGTGGISPTTKRSPAKKKASEKKGTAKKPATKKTSAAAKKSPSTSPKKASPKKPLTKKAPAVAKKPLTKKAPATAKKPKAKKATAKKAPAKSPKKATTKKAKAAASKKKPAAKKAVAKKPSTKKAPAKKPRAAAGKTKVTPKKKAASPKKAPAAKPKEKKRVTIAATEDVSSSAPKKRAAQLKTPVVRPPIAKGVPAPQMEAHYSRDELLSYLKKTLNYNGPTGRNVTKRNIAKVIAAHFNHNGRSADPFGLIDASHRKKKRVKHSDDPFKGLRRKYLSA